jgi:hypothetical protein
MTAPKITDDEIIDALSAGLGVMDISRKYNMSHGSVSVRIKRLPLKGYSPKHDLTHTIPDGFLLKGTSTLYDADGKVKTQWVKTTQDKEYLKEMMNAVIVGLSSELPVYDRTLYKPKEVESDKLVVFPIGDLHVGMMAWKKETGENWSLKHSEIAVYEAFKRVIAAAPNAQECAIINCGDFFHRDNMQGMTARSGNILDCDSRYPHMVEVGVKLIRFVISLALQKFSLVRIINVVGNHDQCTSMFLTTCLKHVYENDPRVKVGEASTPIHYLQWGKVLIAATHGDTTKMDQLPGVVASDQPKLWGDTQFRYGITGHIHSNNRREFPGMLVESFRTLAASDSFATWYGWRSGRDTQAIVYHKDHGEIERYTVGISMIKEYLSTV